MIGKARCAWRLRAAMVRPVPRFHRAGAAASQDPACFTQS